MMNTVVLVKLNLSRNPLKTRKSFRLTIEPSLCLSVTSRRNPLKTRKSFRLTECFESEAFTVLS